MDDSLLLSPKNTMPRIDKMWAFLSVDPDDGNEGVCAATLSPLLGPVPLIAADEARLKSLTPIAEEIARLSGKEIVLVEFSTRTELRRLGGGGDG